MKKEKNISVGSIQPTHAQRKKYFSYDKNRKIAPFERFFAFYLHTCKIFRNFAPDFM